MTRTPDPATLAPHVEEPWREAFVVELRLLDVPGARIGDALSEVDTHCADSAESALDAFGDPVLYARSLGLPAGEGVESDIRWGGVWSGLQLVALFAVPEAVKGLVRGGTTGLTGGILLTVGLMLAVFAVLAVRSGWVVRGVVERPGRWSLALGATLTAVVLPTVLWRTVVVSLPSVAVLVGGLLLLVVGTVMSARSLGEPDDIVDPTAPRVRRRTFPMSAFLMPVGTVVLAILAAATA